MKTRGMLSRAVSPFCLLKETRMTLCIVQYMETTQDMFIPQINIEIFFSLTPVSFLFLATKMRKNFMKRVTRKAVKHTYASQNYVYLDFVSYTSCILVISRVILLVQVFMKYSNDKERNSNFLVELVTTSCCLFFSGHKPVSMVLKQ